MKQEETFAGVLEGVRKNEKEFQITGVWKDPREE